MPINSKEETVIEKSKRNSNVSKYIEDKIIIDEEDILHPGKSSKMILEGKVLGRFGQLHPSISDERNLPKDTYLFEILVKPLIDAATRKNKLITSFKEFSTKPFLERDISVILSKENTYAETIGIISSWKLQIVGFPDLEGNLDHLKKLMKAIYHYANYN